MVVPGNRDQQQQQQKTGTWQDISVGSARKRDSTHKTLTVSESQAWDSLCKSDFADDILSWNDKICKMHKKDWECRRLLACQLRTLTRWWHFIKQVFLSSFVKRQVKTSKVLRKMIFPNATLSLKHDIAREQAVMGTPWGMVCCWTSMTLSDTVI